MGAAIRIINMGFLVAIMFIVKNYDSNVCALSYTVSSWLSFDFEADYIRDRYVHEVDPYEWNPKKEEKDRNNPIPDHDYVKIIFAIVLLLVNTLFFMFFRREPLNGIISTASSISVAILIISIHTGLMSKLYHKIRK